MQAINARSVLSAVVVLGATLSNALILSPGVLKTSVVQPASGSVYAYISGTLTRSYIGEEVTVLHLDAPFSASGNSLGGNDVNYPYFEINDALAEMGRYTGVLFSYEITPTTPVGLYNLVATLTGPSTFYFGSGPAFDPFGEPYRDRYTTDIRGFTIDVVSPQAVPEPSILVVCSAFGAGVWIRRKRKCSS